MSEKDEAYDLAKQIMESYACPDNAAVMNASVVMLAREVIRLRGAAGEARNRAPEELTYHIESFTCRWGEVENRLNNYARSHPEQDFLSLVFQRQHEDGRSEVYRSVWASVKHTSPQAGQAFEAAPLQEGPAAGPAGDVPTKAAGQDLPAMLREAADHYRALAFGEQLHAFDTVGDVAVILRAAMDIEHPAAPTAAPAGMPEEPPAMSPLGVHLRYETELRAYAERVTAERGDAVFEKNEAYRQRNHLVAALARLFPSGIRRTNIIGWDDEWHGCCFIDLPSGQISYHYHDSQAHLFSDLPPYEKPWDGHEKDGVHERLRALCPTTDGGKPNGE